MTSHCVSVLAAIFVPQANEMYYDLGGAFGFLSTTFVSLYYPSLKAKYWHGVNISFPPLSSFAPRQLLLSAALGIWSLRLGSFLVKVCNLRGPLNICSYVNAHHAESTQGWRYEFDDFEFVRLVLIVCNGRRLEIR
jgi:hypothetical protein